LEKNIKELIYDYDEKLKNMNGIIEHSNDVANTYKRYLFNETNNLRQILVKMRGIEREKRDLESELSSLTIKHSFLEKNLLELNTKFYNLKNSLTNEKLEHA